MSNSASLASILLPIDGNILLFLQSDLPHSRANLISRARTSSSFGSIGSLDNIDDFCDDFCLEVGLLMVKVKQCTKVNSLSLENKQKCDGAVGRFSACLENLLSPRLADDVKTSSQGIPSKRLNLLRKYLALARVRNKSFSDLDQAFGGLLIFPTDEKEQGKLIRAISKFRHVLDEVCHHGNSPAFDHGESLPSSTVAELKFSSAKAFAAHISQLGQMSLFPGHIPSPSQFWISLRSVNHSSPAHLPSNLEELVSEVFNWTIAYREAVPPYGYCLSHIVGLIGPASELHLDKFSYLGLNQVSFASEDRDDSRKPGSLADLNLASETTFNVSRGGAVQAKYSNRGGLMKASPRYFEHLVEQESQHGSARDRNTLNPGPAASAMVTYAPPIKYQRNVLRITSLEYIMRDLSRFSLRHRLELCYEVVNALTSTGWIGSEFGIRNIVFVSFDSDVGIDLSTPWLEINEALDSIISDPLLTGDIEVTSSPILLRLGMFLLHILYYDRFVDLKIPDSFEDDAMDHSISNYLKAWEAIEDDKFDNRVRRGCATAIKACLRQDAFPIDINYNSVAFRQLVRDNIVRPLEMDYRSFLYETEVEQDETILGIPNWQTGSETGQDTNESISAAIDKDKTLTVSQDPGSFEPEHPYQILHTDYSVTSTKKCRFQLFDNDEDEDGNASIRRAIKWLSELDKYLEKILGPVTDLILAAETIIQALKQTKSSDKFVELLSDEPNVDNVFDAISLRKMFDEYSSLNKSTYGDKGIDIVLQTHGLSVGLIEATRRTKIAILDTGIDLMVPAIQGYRDRVAEVRNWVPDGTGKVDSTDVVDRFGHGTHTAALLLRSAPAAIICVARIANDGYLDDDEYVAKAIEWAVDFCKADIVTMSFGLDDHSPAVENAILAASAKKKIFFAATSNEGGNEPVAYPARYEQVIGVSSCDGKGNPSDFNPNPIDKYPFVTLGESVTSSWPLHLDDRTGRMRRSGTSFATPILAGLAASLIDFTRIKLGIGPEKLQRLRTTAGIKAILRLISEKRERSSFYYVAPWVYWAKQANEDGFFKYSFLNALNRA